MLGSADVAVRRCLKVSTGLNPRHLGVLHNSPVGPLSVVIENNRITRLEWAALSGPSHPVGEEAVAQLRAYFEGRLDRFDLPMAPLKTAFQQQFAEALCAIPKGQTKTYGDLAKMLGVSAQAIGQACGANPIPVIVPCHRVLAQCGLGGFSGAGGVEAKVTLLRHESAASLLI